MTVVPLPVMIADSPSLTLTIRPSVLALKWAADGFVKLLFDKATGQTIGGAVVGLNAGELISEICLAIEMGADAEDIGRTIHPHPTLSESVGFTAEVYTGTVTDLPPPRRR